LADRVLPEPGQPLVGGVVVVDAVDRERRLQRREPEHEPVVLARRVAVGHATEADHRVAPHDGGLARHALHDFEHRLGVRAPPRVGHLREELPRVAVARLRLDRHAGDVTPASVGWTTMIDSVGNAAASPEREQPYAALGLKPDEYRRIREILGRRPTGAELAMYSVMWSEHCSYKSSKVWLRQFGQKVSPEMKQHLMVGIGENAGVVDIGEGWAVTFKIESHNHPSYVEPFQGAAAGVGG